MKEKEYGSGYFGKWIRDEFGLAAYRYTCNQVKDPKAITPLYEDWRSKTEHLHQVGNDRLVGVASNYGYIQVRQDEGSPKYLNEHDPKRGHYAGGFGYLTDGKDVLSTYYTGKEESFERIFGIGYLRKTVREHDLAVDQVVFAPFGDDPVLISQVTITNNRKVTTDLRWIEYWGCNMYQFSINAYTSNLLKRSEKHPRQIRQEFSEQFKHEFTIVEDGKGLLERKYIEGSTENGKPSEPQGVFEDLDPPMTFLVSLDAKVDGFSTNVSEFFGNGGVEAPDGLKKDLSSNISSTETERALLLERKLQLEPDASQTLYFVYGYLPEGFELNTLLSKYEKDLSQRWKKSSECWKGDRIELKIPNEMWIDRELMWHNYYLRGALTYDSFFKEHILSQGHVYQYIIGFQGAARDPLQHALPFVYSNPEIVKNVLRYTLKEVRKSGEIPYGITGSGKIMPAPFKPSDQEMWLLWLASEYVLATRDTDFLEEEIFTWPVYGPRAEKAKVRVVLARCYKHFTEKTGTGRHGIQRLSNGDWNDGVVIGHVSTQKHREVQKVGESVLNAAMASKTLKIYSEMLKFIDDNELAKKAFEYAEQQREAVHSQWTGKWFKRAWLTEDIGWVGEDQMWLEPQPWAIIGGAADLEQRKILVQSIDELVRKPSKIGAMLLSKGLELESSKLGTGINAGIWLSINGTLIWALSLVDGKIAFDEWKKNTRAVHAEEYPEVWYGIWSGPDFYNSMLSNYPGQTGFDESILKEDERKNISELPIAGVNWTDFPVMNLHPHAWPIFNTTNLIGAEFTAEGIEFSPTLPKEEYKFTSPLFEFEKLKDGYSGWYSPQVAGNWKLSLKLSMEELKQFTTMKVNEEEIPIIIEEDKISWKGTSTPDKPLKWIIKK